MNNIAEEDYRQLSELQHFKFCRRQWGLIHIEQQWGENLLTTQGELMHEHAHDENASELRGDKLIVHGMRVKSNKMGAVGVCDIVEFTKDPEGISLYGREGLWLPRPVEYKRGRQKQDHSDEMQLCGQAICLEEMLCCSIPEGDLFYGEPHRRATVKFDSELRQMVTDAFSEMNELYQRGYTPKVRITKSCAACSLKNICMPAAEYLSARKYVLNMLEEK